MNTDPPVQREEEQKNLDQSLTINSVAQREDEIKNPVSTEILKGYDDAGKLRDVWATQLDLDQKTSAKGLLYYIEELMKLGRIYEAKGLADKLPAEFRQEERVRFLLEEECVIKTRVKELECLDDWVLQVDGKDRNAEGISVWYRYTSGSPIIEAKVKLRLEASLVNICCIANEIDLWSMFLSRPLAIETKDCVRYGFATMVPYIDVKMPWPMSHRECYIDLKVYDLIVEEKRIVVCSQDLGDETQYLQFNIPPVENGKVRMKTKISAIGETINSKITDMTLMFSVDMAMPVPQSLVNWITRHVTWHIFKQFRKLCVNLPDPHLERMKVDKTGAYKYLKDRMKVLFEDIA